MKDLGAKSQLTGDVGERLVQLDSSNCAIGLSKLRLLRECLTGYGFGGARVLCS